MYLIERQILPSGQHSCWAPFSGGTSQLEDKEMLQGMYLQLPQVHLSRVLPD